MQRLIGILGLLLAVFVLAQPAYAFAPDDEKLTEEMHRKYGPLSSWEAEMTFSEHPDVTVRLWYARGKWRQEWIGDESSVAIGRGFNAVAQCAGGVFARSPLFAWMVPNPVEAWYSWGVNKDARNFGFCGSQPCFIIGGGLADETLPVVQLNNEDLSPILIRYMAGGVLTSIEYGNYRTFGGFRLPQSVRVTVGADQSLEAKVKWISVNRADSEELYAREMLDTTPCAEPPAPFDFLRDSFRYPQSN